VTVSHDRVINAAHKAGGNAARRHKRGGRVDAPDPRAGSLLARKAATAWHAGFAEAHGAAGGAESKAASGYDLTPQSGMISLDIPDGVIDPVPGGVEGPSHVTVAYLGKNVDDDAFDEACRRTQDAASRIPGPLSATLSGIGSFPPDERGKTPVFIPASIPGGDRLRSDLEDLSASQHPDWNPHVTLAFTQPGDPAIPPQPHKVVPFTHVSVHRGDDVRRFPFGGQSQVKEMDMSVLTGMERKVGPAGYTHGWVYHGIPGTGDHVHHPSHGKGIVTAVTDKHVSVKFSGSGAERTFEHSKPRTGQATGFVKRGDHEAAKAGHDVPKPEKAHAPVASFSPGYLRGEGATDSDVAELARRYQVMHGKPPAAADLAKIRRAKPGKATTDMSRDDGLAKARSIHEADRAAGGGHLPPLALLGNEKHPDGLVTARAVDHEGREYEIAHDKNAATVTVNHKGKSLTEPAGANPTQKARELAGKLTAPAPAEAKPEADDFWAHEQPKTPPPPPAPKPVFNQPGMFAEPDKLGTAPMFGDKFGTADVTKPNADAVASPSPHAATARQVAAGVRSETGLVRGQREEAETRLHAAARHLEAGNHAEAVRELDDTAHAAGLRGGGVIKGSTAAKARDLAAKIRAERAPETPTAQPVGDPKAFINSHYGQWKNQLKPAQEKAIGFYQSPGFALMNGQLRGADPERLKASEHASDNDLARARKASSDLSSAIRAAPPLQKPVKVYRGFDAGQFGSLTPGSVVTDKGFTSTSLTDDAGAVGRAARPATAEIHLPAGTKAAAGSSRELILPAGSAFRVHSVTTRNGMPHARLELVPKPDKPHREAKDAGVAGEVKDLATAITSVSGREDAVRRHLADAGTAIGDGDVKTAYGALDMARRHALGEFGANPDRPVLLGDKTEAWRPIIRLRDSVRATAPRDA
jgi:hypothetical protein